MGRSQRATHLLLETRTRVLDEEWENTFRRWYPDFRPQGEANKAASPAKISLSPGSSAGAVSRPDGCSRRGRTPNKVRSRVSRHYSQIEYITQHV